MTIDGIPRPATVVATDGDRTLVRFRDAGGFREEWVPSSQALLVESTRGRPSYLKLVGLVVVAAVGLLLVLYPGSDKPLSQTTSTPTTTPTVAATVRPRGPVTAVVLGDSFSAAKGNPEGTPSALALAARSLGWVPTVQATKGSGFTAGTTLGTRVAALREAPTVLVLQAGASDTAASPDALTKAAGEVLDTVARRFPTTHVILVGPFAMEQPPDGQLKRVARTLAEVAAAHRVVFVDPISAGWITDLNAGGFTSASGFYPNAAGHAFLATRLKAALRY